MIALLSDPRSSSFSPKILSYALSGASAAVHHVLFQKQNGRFYLALWQEVSSFDLDTKRDVAVRTQQVVLSLPAAAREMKTFLPVRSAVPVSDQASISQLTLDVPDEPLIVEITL